MEGGAGLERDRRCFVCFYFREWSVRRVLTGLEVESGVAINALVMLRRMWEGLATPFALRVNEEGVLL